ncbi:hypothetical protein Arcpr_0542 [Archaeoglobus profundus DSM 5631]|uniref:Uncharacterized protein n=1 Tax=Archaeoglobus profundus (strain DSM 5631 / JCM 9629 / NBRC 100127 / Av18) TaxID=572546 RepID=D2RH33_ARCPA|nr:hypothetical protein Arcpr_0542 [Archaeoglobus profundus DSM 5631]
MVMFLDSIVKEKNLKMRDWVVLSNDCKGRLVCHSVAR